MVKLQQNPVEDRAQQVTLLEGQKGSRFDEASCCKGAGNAEAGHARCCRSVCLPENETCESRGSGQQDSPLTSLLLLLRNTQVPKLQTT